MNAKFFSIHEILTKESSLEAIYELLQIPNPALELKQDVSVGIVEFLSTLRDELCVVAESDYADPVYRDSYYHHYSLKLRPYAKDCVRLSFFEPEYSDLNDFISKGTEEIQKTYLGFLVLRPLIQCIGRNAIDVRAKKTHLSAIEICKAKVKATCMGHKLTVKAFPHSSQDSEYMSCAENSVWTMLEYFGNKYTVYDPILPSKIIQALEDYKYDRMIPTTGLSYSHISMLLKKRGFETVVYHCDRPNFKELFTCYIESGLPLIECIRGKDFGGHAVVCIGRKKCDISQFSTIEDVVIDGIPKHLSYWNQHVDTFVVNDDNLPSYHMANFGAPVKDYSADKDATIRTFIVPMHEEIFVPAENAIALSNIFVARTKEVDNCCLRTFLTTSRSYKEYIINHKDLSAENKQQLIMLDLPKFVWITEFVEVKENSTELISGMLALDATGNTHEVVLEKSIIFMICKGRGFYCDNHTGEYIYSIFNFPALFGRYKGNLK